MEIYFGCEAQEKIAHKDLHSETSGGGRVRVTFTNMSKDILQLYWVSPKDEEKWQLDMEPGQTGAQNTFSGHVFSIRDKNENNLKTLIRIDTDKDIGIVFN